MDKILLIEDTILERKKLGTAINNSIDEFNLRGQVELEILSKEGSEIDTLFPEGTDFSKGTEALEDRLAAYLNGKKDKIKLLVIDHDLSRFKNDKLSEPVISIASHSASIPLVRYARISRKTVDDLADAIDAGSEFSIKIDTSNEINAARKIVNIYDGFLKIKTGLNKIDKSIQNRGAHSILAAITNAKTQEDNFWMYVSGSSLLRELIELNDIMSSKGLSEIDKGELIKDRLSYVLGYWFYNVVLAFPGVILNKTATYSYLQIKEEDFDKYKKNFEEAKYKGPFSLNEDFWWKESLDEILDNQDVETGFDLLKKNGIKIEKEDYGYYCIMTKKPISYEESKSLSWLPNGAILSRVSEELYEQYAPFFGEY